MFGTYQRSNLRIEIAASLKDIKAGLTQPKQLEQWIWPQHLKPVEKVSSESFSKVSSTDTQASSLSLGQVLESQLGPVVITHEVEALTDVGVRFLLSGSIDGFHEWQWGDGWVQSRLEGISLLPLNLGQTLGLTRFKQYLEQDSRKGS